MSNVAKTIVSPYRLLMVVAVVVFVTEMAVMYAISSFVTLSPIATALLDATLLIILMSPVLYAVLMRPARRQLYLMIQAMEHSPVCLLVTDNAGNPQYTNRACAKVGGSGPAVKTGRTGARFTLERSAVVRAALQEAIQKGQAWSGVNQYRTQDGEPRWERSSVTPIKDNHGHITNFIVTGEDITQEMQMQNQLVESDKMAAVGTLSAGVSHEFKNFLASIVANASFALDCIDDEDGCEQARESLAQILEVGDMANEVVQSLLTYSRTEQGNSIQLRDIGSLVRNGLRFVKKEISNSAIELIVEIGETSPVAVSVSRFQQVLLNLLINAQHAIGSNGVITIRLFQEDTNVKLIIGDTGKGIAPEDLARVFDPFFSTKGVHGGDDVAGTGLGLSVSRNIAQEHGGSLTVDSSVGNGTTFTLTLPISVSEEPDRGSGKSDRPAECSSGV